MIAILDVNTIWRRKFAEALRRSFADVILCAPYAGAGSSAETGDLPIRLPRGWASALAGLAMPLLLRRLRRATDGPPDVIIVTTPHYLKLARRAAASSTIVYYCSDDYRGYAGWNPERIKRDERSLCRIAALSIFVSEALRKRAVEEYGLDPDKTFVSPNATEPRFAGATERPAGLATLPGPVFGVAGVFSTRIDLAFLAEVAADPRVASLALVGPVDAELEGSPLLAQLRAHSKVHFFGRQPHADMAKWMASFDIAIIPYAATPFNYFCSPMRFYDHRALGQPIIATPHCDQIAAHPDVITGSSSDVPKLIEQALAAATAGRRPRMETWDDRIGALRKSAIAGAVFPQ